VKSAFAEAAKADGQPAAQLLRGFIPDSVKRWRAAAWYDAWFRRRGRVGLDSANAGHLILARDLEAAFAPRRAQTPGRLDRPTHRGWHRRASSWTCGAHGPPRRDSEWRPRVYSCSVTA